VVATGENGVRLREEAKAAWVTVAKGWKQGKVGGGPQRITKDRRQPPTATNIKIRALRLSKSNVKNGLIDAQSINISFPEINLNCRWLDSAAGDIPFNRRNNRRDCLVPGDDLPANTNQAPANQRNLDAFI
jgi:hypothetical protein